MQKEVGVWQFRKNGNWEYYDEEDSQLIEEHYQNGEQFFKAIGFSESRGMAFLVDFATMTQTTEKSRSELHIRRRLEMRQADDQQDQDDEEQQPKARGEVKKKHRWTKEEQEHWKAQTALGPQSMRNGKVDFGHVSGDPHGKRCFEKMLENEQRLCGSYAVFYHSYSHIALLYEVQTALAAKLFRFKSNFATIPRIRVYPFERWNTAQDLAAHFPQWGSQRDHHPDFREVAISCTLSLFAPDKEATPTYWFLRGYSCTDVPFLQIAEKLLQECGVDETTAKKLGKDIVALSQKHGLDVSQYGGSACKSGRAGHLLQIFIRRNLIDKYVYPALEYGVPDDKRKPMSKYLDGNGPIAGQARILCHPELFMDVEKSRLYIYSADPDYHRNRDAFQKAMSELLEPVLGGESERQKAAEGLYGGKDKLPKWFTPEPQLLMGLAKAINFYM